MKKALVACRSGMGSSLMLKIKVEQVIKENNFPIIVEHSTLDAVPVFDGDLAITMADIAKEITGQIPYVIGINNLMDKKEIKEKLENYLEKSGMK
ncbi:PTS system ascorbate-specific IIB component [Thermohydrogenium kirishiense]|nr:PTS system ascorbate-specific IIB component [Thermohydrogenium kirishiense]